MITALIGCEESQAVTIALRKRGIEAFSCDKKDCSGGHPEWHLKMDVFEAIKLKKWDLGIFFPDCTYLTVSANKWYKDQPQPKSGVLVGAARREARRKAIQFAKDLYFCDIPSVGIENPIGVLSTQFRKPNQVIQPWMFGHGETKATCLWLRGLPNLIPTNIVEGREGRIWKIPPGSERATIRSKTYPGIAEAMADQWGDHLLKDFSAPIYFIPKISQDPLSRAKVIA